LSAFVLLLGSNLDNRLEFLQLALSSLSAHTDITVEQASDIYESPALEMDAESGNFLNQALLITTQLPPSALLGATQEIERQIGRKQEDKGKRLPRTIDIDILLCDAEIVSEDDLQIPHPRLRQRGFALAPLLEILPEALDPISGKPYADFYDAELQQQVWKFQANEISAR
jgi:2-amino-4-hydroxy-6-hydroxymethyldihydropteridine diphosphokinase